MTCKQKLAPGACCFTSTITFNSVAMFMPVRNHTKVYKTRVNRDDINDATYRKLFRFDKANVEWLAETFLPTNYETRGGCLTQVQRMETTLAYLADPGYQTSVAQKMGISQATVSRCVADSLERISAQQSTWIKFPVSNTDVANTKQRWGEKLHVHMARFL